MTLMKAHLLNKLDQIKARKLQSVILYVCSVMSVEMHEHSMKHRHQDYIYDRLKKHAIQLHTKDIVEKVVVDTIDKPEALSQDQLYKVIKDCIKQRTRPPSDPIKGTKLPPFSRPQVR